MMRGHSRREFLGTASLAAAAVVGGMPAAAASAAERWQPRWILASALYGTFPLAEILLEVAKSGPGRHVALGYAGSFGRAGRRARRARDRGHVDARRPHVPHRQRGDRAVRHARRARGRVGWISLARAGISAPG
jgi:hypothetical protein